MNANKDNILSVHNKYFKCALAHNAIFLFNCPLHLLRCKQ